MSKSVMPASRAACTTSRLCSRSSFMPRLLVPSPTTETTSPELPSLRKVISAMPFSLRNYPADAFHGCRRMHAPYVTTCLVACTSEDSPFFASLKYMLVLGSL